jgi:molybdenum cofactor cytidylyltransferase
MIAALVLAAGRAERMGSPKLLARLGGRTMLERVIAAARRSRCDDVLVVLGSDAEAIDRVASGAGARTVLNPRYGEGMGTSVAAGVAALSPGCDAAVVLLGDQPFVTPEIIDALIDAYRSTGRPLVASRYGAVRGAPTLIARAMFEEAMRLSGDTGGRVLLQRHPDLVAEVELGTGAASRDVDTPEDLAEAQRMVADGPPSGQVLTDL